MSTGQGGLYKPEGAGNSDVPKMKLHLRILVVDHNIGSLLHVKSILEDLSHQVTTAEGARSAFEILKTDEEQYDVVMADTNLPGIKMSHFVQVVRIYFDIPIIMMFSKQLDMYEDYNMVSTAMRLGVSFFYSKPITSRELSYVWQHVYKTRRDVYEARQMLNIMRVERPSISSSSDSGGIVHESGNGMQPNQPRL